MSLHIPETADIGDTNGILELARHAKPQWNCSDITIKHFVEGNTNKIIGCYRDENPDDMVLFRIYGNNTEVMIDRQMEKRNMLRIHASGCGPELYFSFDNGLCYEYIPGVCLCTDMIRNSSVWQLVAKEVARLHAIKPDTQDDMDRSPSIFKTLEHWLELSPETFQDTEKMEKYRKHIGSKEDLRRELDELQRHLDGLHSPVVFCHNDIILNNIVYDKKKEKVTFIDYEYAAFNYLAFDIGNHFNEFAGVDNVDYNLYPNERFQKKWIRTYLEEKHVLEGKHKIPVSFKEIQSIYVLANKFALASHLFWALWALIQTRHSDLDFPFLDYGIIRLDEYYKRKDEFLSLKMPDRCPAKIATRRPSSC